MTIEKYTSFDEARRNQWVFTPDENYYRRLHNFYKFASRLMPPKNARGIFKYRDISETRKNTGK